MRLRLVTGLALLLAVVAAMESPPSKRAIPNAPAGATLKKEESTVVEGSGEPPSTKAGTVDTETHKSSGYSPDDEDAVEGSGAPVTTSPSKNPAPPAVVTGGGGSQPPVKPQPPAPPPPAPHPADSDDESVEGSGDEKDDGGTPFTPASITTTTTTTASPAVVQPSGGPAAPPKTMWETVAVTETPVVTTRGPVYEQPKTTPSTREKSTERSPTRPNTTEQPALFPFHSMLKPGIFAAVVGGTVVGLLMAILLVMFIVYRMRKRDEGSYALEEPKQRPYAGYAYTKASSNKEFYA